MPRTPTSPGTGNLVGITRGSEPTATLAYEQGSGRIAALISQGATQTVFSFNSRGRRASQGTPASPLAVRFIYDDADRLVGCSDASLGVSASYAFDAHSDLCCLSKRCYDPAPRSSSPRTPPRPTGRGGSLW